MLIVDAQVHIWGKNLPTNPAHRQITTFSKDDLLKEMDEAGVNAAVIHPPGWDPDSNELAVEAARQHPDRLAILGNFPLDRQESHALIDGWKQRPGMLGLRFTFNQPHQRTWPTDGTMDWLCFPFFDSPSVFAALLDPEKGGHFRIAPEVTGGRVVHKQFYWPDSNVLVTRFYSPDGVGELVRIGTERGRKVRPDLKVGICGEHGGDPASIAFCDATGLDYVSCSAFRVPVARLAAAQAAIRTKRGGGADGTD